MVLQLDMIWGFPFPNVLHCSIKSISTFEDDRGLNEIEAAKSEIPDDGDIDKPAK